MRDEGLHKHLNMVGYCMRDNGENHFDFVHHNVLSNDVNEGLGKKLGYYRLIAGWAKNNSTKSSLTFLKIIGLDCLNGRK